MEAKWITNHSARPFYLRRAFSLAEKPVRAELLACEEAFCAPEPFDYDAVVQMEREGLLP